MKNPSQKWMYRLVITHLPYVSCYIKKNNNEDNKKEIMWKRFFYPYELSFVLLLHIDGYLFDIETG